MSLKLNPLIGFRLKQANQKPAGLLTFKSADLKV